ncbi:MAG: rod shape-determining protein RodA [Oscillospiraceae bacterium]|nr:rod shape-determining protein RodA [Oscillospiraceae bacterium]
MSKLLISKKILKDLDFVLLLTVLAIVAVGIVNIYSATYKDAGFYYVKRQIFWLCFSLIVMYVLILIDYSTIGVYSEIIYWFFNVALLFTFLFAIATNGAKGWLYFGPISFQTSEFAKIALCIFLAKKISEFEGKISKISELLIIIGYAAITMALIVIEPDMGMTMLCFFMVLGIIYVSGTDWKQITALLILIAGIIVFVLKFQMLPSYMRDRITGFFDTSGTQTDIYQLLQSIIAIGSGKIFGNGFLQSIKVSGGFVPEASTDFIFSVIGEEWGLIGGTILILLYIILISRVIKISKKAKNSFGMIFSSGIASLWIFQIFQNIGMTIGVMPVTGVTLPFVSYGGSSLLSCFMALGLILNIGMRKKKFMF